jgi:thymidylate synthase
VTANRPEIRQASRQKIWAFLQDERGAGKISAIRSQAGSRIDLEIFTIEQALPPVVDDASDWLPGRIEADLVLAHLKHPDLTHALADLCRRDGVPMIAPGQKGALSGVLTPRTCCALTDQDGLGAYAEHFGLPVFDIRMEGDRIRDIQVLRGAPCGATWEAARRIIGLTLDEARIRIGLETQYFCVADPAGWDPISGRSPVHIAGELHKAALAAALRSLIR